MACESVLRDRSLVRGDPLLMVHYDLPATLGAPGQARRLVADTLTGPAAPAGATAETVYTAQLLVSELVTSAVMHARTELHLGISGDAQTLLFAVADGHPDPPPGVSPALEFDATAVDYEEPGRGIEVIVGLADDFGWRRRDDGAGKVMWFTIRVPGSDGD